MSHPFTFFTTETSQREDNITLEICKNLLIHEITLLAYDESERRSDEVIGRVELRNEEARHSYVDAPFDYLQTRTFQEEIKIIGVAELLRHDLFSRISIDSPLMRGFATMNMEDFIGAPLNTQTDPFFTLTFRFKKKGRVLIIFKGVWLDEDGNDPSPYPGPGL